MTEPDDIEPGDIEHFEIEARLDVTLKVNETDWFKPGASGRIRFKGFPDEQRIKDAYSYLLFAVIDPQLTGALEHVQQRLDNEQQRKKGN